jgi:hypothetical protein
MSFPKFSGLWGCYWSFCWTIHLEFLISSL